MNANISVDILLKVELRQQKMFKNNFETEKKNVV